MPSMEGRDPSFHLWQKPALHLDIMNRISSMDYECCYGLDRLLEWQKMSPNSWKDCFAKMFKC